MNRQAWIRAYATLAALLIGAGLLLRLPLLGTGFTVDDYAQLSMMRGQYPVPRAGWQLFTFSTGHAENTALRAAGFFPWWSHPELRVSLFRPLSSALMWFDLRTFADDAFLYHVHSAVWWLAMMTLLAAALRCMLPPWPALLALGLCSVQGGHAIFLGWIANRNAVVASAFALLGLWLLSRTTERARYVALLSFATGLAASEVAVSYFGYAAAYEWQRADTTQQRRKLLAPWCALLAMYLMLRAALGFGTHGSAQYIDPISESAAFLRAALYRLPTLVGDLVLSIQSNWWGGGFPWVNQGVQLGLWPQAWADDLRPMHGVQLVCGVLAMAVFAFLALRLWRNSSELCRRNRWLVAGTVFALLPSLGSMPENRLLLPAFFGWSAIMASLLCEYFGRPSRAAKLAIAALVGVQLLGPIYFTYKSVHDVPLLARIARNAILDPRLDDIMRRRRLLLFGAIDPTTTIYVQLARRVHDAPAPGMSQLLTCGYVPQRLQRLSANSFAIERLQASLTAPDLYAVAFNREPLRTGDQFTADGMQVAVERAVDGLPLRARFTLDVALDDPSVVLIQQTLQGLRPMAFPEIGASVIVDPPVPPFALDDQP